MRMFTAKVLAQGLRREQTRPHASKCARRSHHCASYLTSSTSKVMALQRDTPMTTPKIVGTSLMLMQPLLRQMKRPNTRQRTRRRRRHRMQRNRLSHQRRQKDPLCSRCALTPATVSVCAVHAPCDVVADGKRGAYAQLWQHGHNARLS